MPTARSDSMTLPNSPRMCTGKISPKRHNASKKKRSGGRSGSEPRIPRTTPRISTLQSISARNRIAPIAPERSPAYAHAGRCLASLVFVALHHVEYASHRRAGETPCNDLVNGQVLFDEGLEDGIEDLIGWQRIGVLLVRAQLGRGRTGQHPVWNHRIPGIAVPGQPIHEGLAAI